MFHSKVTRRQLLHAGLMAGGLAALPLHLRRGLPVASVAAAPAPFGSFQGTWQRTDQPVAQGRVNRTWMWGPAPLSDQMREPYADSPGAERTVQYFDKSRMEITHPDGDPSSIWYVTNGLLVKELMTGYRQLGDSSTRPNDPAHVNVAGDANDPNGPTYATFNKLMGYGAIPNGWTIIQTVNRMGTVGNDSSLGSYNVTATDVGAPTNHTVASVFWDFMNNSGTVFENGSYVTAKLFTNPFYATGYPLTEAYWSAVLVGDVQKQVLVQVFERRVLTYTPSNPAGWKVEAGNVGQHYSQWKENASTLRELANRLDIQIGTLIDPNAAFWSNKPWDDIASTEFNLAINSVFWHQMMPQTGQIDYTLPDSQTSLAQSWGMGVRGADLVYSLFLPDWIKNGSFTRNALITMIQQNTAAIMGHYQESISAWGVVNEAGFSSPWDTSDFFYQKIGSDYVDIAFQAARETNPNATLLYNDFGNETLTSPKYAQTKQIVGSLKSEGLLDGLGVEMHIDAAQPCPTKSDIVAGFQSYGLPIYISELDVDLRNVGGTDSERFELQAAIYRDTIDAALDSGVCKSITFWGFGDTYSWLESPTFNGSPKAQPTLFDDNLKPKPAYYAVRDVLRSKL